MGELNTFQHTLPSGKSVELRHLDLVDLLLDGRIPDPLTGLVELMIAQTLQSRGTATREERDAVASLLESSPEHQDRSTEFVRFIVRQASVTPIITDDVKEARTLRAEGQAVDHIAHYTRDDLYSIFFAAQGVAADLIPFLLRALFPVEPMAAVSDGDGDAASEPAAGGPAGTDVGGVHGGLGGGEVGPVRGEQPVRAKRSRRPKVDHSTAPR